MRGCFKSILQCHTQRSEVSQYMPETLDSTLQENSVYVPRLGQFILYWTFKTSSDVHDIKN